MGTLTLPTTGTLSGLSLVNDTNAIVAILAAAQQGASAPTTATTGLTSTAGVLWHDTGTATVKLRNQADTAWITLFTINETAGSSSASINSVNGYPIAGARNRIINGNFAVNQRTYVSGTALAAGIYGHDRWKGGAGGGTYTFTAALPDTTITITAGTLTQVIEAGAMEGGTYTLSWSGTATARVNGGSYGASPLTVTAITAGVTCTVEFGTGTVGLVQFEPGAVATPWERRRLNEQFADCQRFYQTGQGVIGAYQTAAAGLYVNAVYPVSMRASPTVAVTSSSLSNTNTPGASAVGVYGVEISALCTATGPCAATINFTANAEL